MAGVKGQKGQRPLKEGEASETTGVRLSKELNEHYDAVAKKLKERNPSVTKSAVMRSVLEFYQEYAETAFKQKHLPEKS